MLPGMLVTYMFPGGGCCGGGVILRLNLVLTYEITPAFCDDVHFNANRNRTISEFIRSRSCLLMVFTAEDPPAQGRQQSPR